MAQNPLVREKETLTKLCDALVIQRSQVIEIEKTLKEVFYKIRKEGIAPKSLDDLSAILRQSEDREIAVAQKLEYLELVNEKLVKFDFSIFPDLHDFFHTIAGRQRTIIEKYILEEHAKLYKGHDVHGFIVLTKVYARDFATALENAFLSAGRFHPADAQKWIKKAILIDRMLEDAVGKILDVEKLLLRAAKEKLQEFDRSG